MLTGSPPTTKSSRARADSPWWRTAWAGTREARRPVALQSNQSRKFLPKLLTLLHTGFQIAHERILDYAAGHPELHGMGTTATAIALLGNQLYYAHVGDSRLYLVRGANISRLTHDHSYVGRLVQNGVISAEEAETHPQRHILTAALGAGTEISPEIPEHPIALQKGDVLVLCTDGMWSLLGEHEIQGIVAGNEPSEACRALIKLTKDRGGPDNITVQVLRISA